jgi:hypothetical protein
MAEQTGHPAIPGVGDPKIAKAARAIALTLRAVATGLDLSHDELAVAGFLGLGVVSMDASLRTRAHLASACSLLDAESGDG